MNDDEVILAEFRAEGGEHLDALEGALLVLEVHPNDKQAVASAFRAMHSLKGGAGFLGFATLEDVAHAAEGLLDRWRQGDLVPATETVTLMLRARDMCGRLLNGEPLPPGGAAEMIAELHEAAAAPTGTVAVALALAPPGRLDAGRGTGPNVVAAASAQSPQTPGAPPGPSAPVGAEASPATHAVRFSTRRFDDTTVRVDIGLLDELVNLVGELVVVRNCLLQAMTDGAADAAAAAGARLDQLTSELQAKVMKTRMRTIGSAWGGLPRLVREQASKSGKIVTLEMSGEDTDLDRKLLEVVKDPIGHILRNSIDHGLETPAERRAAGKEPEGHIHISARHSGNHVHVDITDDGRGINALRVALRAVDMGIISLEEAERMSDADRLRLVFRPGLSTATELTPLSGRGVGMDVVLSKVAEAGGSTDVLSTPGLGTTVRLKLPLTLAIFPALLVSVSGQRLCLPQTTLVEAIDLRNVSVRQKLSWNETAGTVTLHERTLPVVPFAEMLGVSPTGSEAARSYALVVESDAARFVVAVDELMGTEDIVVKPIDPTLNPIGLYSGATVWGDGGAALIVDLRAVCARAGIVAETRLPELDPAKRGASASDRDLLRVFVAGLGYAAIRVEDTVRAEEATPVNPFEQDGRWVIGFRGRVVPLARLCPTPEAIVVCAVEGREIGVGVTEVLEVVRSSLALTADAGPPWSRGSALLRGRPALLIHVGRLLALWDGADPDAAPP